MLLVCLQGCLTPVGSGKDVTEEDVHEPEPMRNIIELDHEGTVMDEPEEGKIYHTVLEGETLWRIAKAYEINQEEIMRANGMEDSSVRLGQKLHIPGATEKVEVEKYRPPRKGTKFVPGEDFGHPSVGIVSARFGQWRGGQKLDGVEYTVGTGTKVVASRTGEVILVARAFPGYGTVVILRHGPQYRTFYGYLAETDLQVGDAVAKDDVVGVAGADPGTGETKLHFKLFKGAEPVDPLGQMR